MKASQHIYLSAHAMFRITKFREYTKHYMMRTVAEMIGVTPGALYDIYEGKTYPTLSKYLKLCKVCNFNLTRDANYAYMYELYSPEDLARRVKRIYAPKSNSAIGYAELGRELHIYSGNISDSLKYGKRSSCNVFGRVLVHISQQEFKRGYADALDVED